MPTSKFSSIWILVGVLLLTSVLSVPVQAQSADSRDQQSSDLAGKPPTKTKRPKATPKAKTPTPKPANTLEKTPVASVTPETTGTPMPAYSPTSTTAGSPTATLFGTAAAEHAKTVVAENQTATSSALTASPTPGAPGESGYGSTPNALSLTATSRAMTEYPLSIAAQQTLTAQSNANYEIPVTANKPWSFLGGKRMFWLLEVGLVALLVLFYFLGRELRKNKR